MNELTPEEDFLKYTISELVSMPEEVKVIRTTDEMGVLLSVQVNKEDMGVLIGKNGNTAKALRTLLRVVGMKNKARVNMKIHEPDDNIN